MPRIPFVPLPTLGVRRVCAVAVVAFAVSSATACTSYRPTALSESPSGGVRVTYVSPRTVAVRRRSGEEVSLNGSTEVVGRVEHVSGDTVYVRVHTVRGPRGYAEGVPLNGIAAIVRDRDTVVERRGYNNDRTLALFLVGGLAIVAFIAVVETLGHQPVY